jgi:3'-phosphoadenosine 5'-phosphosulfate sulfotransferase (PAPS reductase)/FAD synthetase
VSWRIGNPEKSTPNTHSFTEDANHLATTRPDELSLSYNGGKDCLVLLVLILACLPALYDPSPATNGTGHAAFSKNSPPTIQALYIAPPDPFPEVEDFVSSTTKEYHLDLTRYALPMRQALEAYQADKPAVKAIFMGTRRTDPFCEFLTGFSPTDKGWPQFMRVNPVLDWHYADIWTVSNPLPTMKKKKSTLTCRHVVHPAPRNPLLHPLPAGLLIPRRR